MILRAVEQDMVQRLAAKLRRLDENLQVGYYFFLSGEIFQLLGPDYSFKILIFVSALRIRIEFVRHTLSLLLSLGRPGRGQT